VLVPAICLVGYRANKIEAKFIIWAYSNDSYHFNLPS